MPLSKKDKRELIDAIKSVDVKELFKTIDDETKRKWSRFGAYDGLKVAAEIILQYPEKKEKAKAEKG